MIDCGHLRAFHLDATWSNASEAEEQMTFETVLALVRKYKAYGYANVTLNDLEEYRVKQVPEAFAGLSYVICTLVVSDEEELKRRVLTSSRDSGYRNFQRAIEWNAALRTRARLSNEYLVDNTAGDPWPAISTIVKILTEQPGLRH
jgi:hypothetical protein